MEPYKTFSSPAEAGSFLAGKEDMASAIQSLFDKTGVSNPYSEINPQHYRLNRRGKLQYQQDLAEAQYLAEMQLMMYQNEYNSPEAMAHRQRDAGQNPDLAGIQAAESAGMSGAVTPPDMAGTETNGQRALGIVDTTLSMMAALSSGAIGVAQAGRKLAGSDFANMSQAFGAVPAIGDALGGIFGLGAGSGNGVEADQYKSVVRDFTRHAPRKYRRSLERYLTHYMQTPQYMRNVYDSMASRAEAKGRFAKTEVDPRTRGDVSSIMTALKPMSEAEFKVAELLLDTEKSKAEKMSAYWMNRDMGAQAESENSQAQAAKGEADIQEIVRAGALKTVKNLEKAMDEGKWWATTALSALYAALSGAMNLPSLGFSSNSSQHTDPKTGQIINSSSNAWNFGK